MTARLAFVVEITLITDNIGTQQTFYFGTEGFATKPSDTPANTVVVERLTDPGSIRRELFSGARVTGPNRPSFGQVVLSNADGALDIWTTYGVSAGPVVIRYGDVRDPYPASWTTVMQAYAHSVIVDYSQVRVILRDRLAVLDKPIVTDVFSGAGGIEGTGIATRTKQMVFGLPGFIPPILIDQNRQIYFVQSNAATANASTLVTSLWQVAEGGVALDYEGFYQTQEDLLATPPSAGYWKIFAPGYDGLSPLGNDSFGPVLIRLGSPPEYDIRVKPFGAVKDSILALARRWTFVDLCSRAGLTVTLADGSTNKTVGNLLIDEGQTYLEAMSDTAQATFTAYGFDALDKFFIVDLADPSEGSDTSAFEFNQHNAKGFSRQPVPGMEIPIWRVIVKSGRTWPSSLRTSATQAQREAFTKTPWQHTFTGTASVVLAANPGAETAEIEIVGTEFEEQSERLRFVQRYIQLFGGRRDLLTLTAQLTPELLALQLHQKVTVKMPRLGCDAGRLFRIITIETSLKARTVTFGLWGGTAGPSDAVLGGGTEGGGIGGLPAVAAGLQIMPPITQTSKGSPVGGGGGSPQTMAAITQTAMASVRGSIAGEVVLQLKCIETPGTTTFNDTSSYVHTVTNTGSATLSAALGRGMGLFNGTSQYLGVNHSSVNLNSSDFAVHGYVYVDVAGGYTTRYAIACGYDGVQTNGRWVLFLDVGNLLVFSEQNGNGANTTHAESATFPLRTLVHVAATKQGTTLRLFIDGVLVSTSTSSVRTGLTNQVYVGAFEVTYNPNAWYWLGYIGPIEIIKGNHVWSTNFTPPTTLFPDLLPSDPGQDADFANVVLLLNCEGDDAGTVFTDSSTYARTATRIGTATTVTATRKFGASGLSTRGGVSGLGYAYAAELNLNGVEFTCEGWAYLESATGYGALIDFRGSAGVADGWVIFTDNALRRLAIYDGPTNLSNVVSGDNAIPPINTWFHWAAVRKSGVVSLFVNGSVVASLTYNPPVTHATGIRVGIAHNTVDGFVGVHDDVRITKGVARYAGSYTPPTAPTPSATPDSYFDSVTLLLHGDGSDAGTVFTDSSSYNRTATRLGAAVTVTGVKKYGTAALKFDNAGDGLSFAYAAGLDLRGVDFTVEGWAYTNAAGTATIVDFKGSGISNAGWLFGADYSTDFLAIYENAAYTLILKTPDNSLPGPNTWYHFAVVRNAGVVTIFINGVSQASATYNPPVTHATGIRVGVNSADLDRMGHLDDLRITKNVARYVGSYTVPTGPFYGL